MTAHVMLYGLRVASEIPLHQRRPWPDEAAPDVEITVGATVSATDERPPGRLLVDLEVDQLYYSAAVDAAGTYLLRFYGTCDFVIDPQLRRVTAHPVSGSDPDLLGVLAAGTLLSFVLAMRGEPVLHASAVDVGGAALAFVAGSGMGKSTMATLLCSAGATLITDDVLRLDLSADRPTCALGATELRLRKAAGDLAARFAQRPAHRLTADARDALAMPAAVTEHLPLHAIVIPVPDRERDKAEITRLDPMRSMLTLLRFPRVVGWVDDEVLQRQFHQLGRLVEQVPVHLAALPWGPPFPDDVAEQVLDAVGVPRATDAMPAGGG